MQEKMLAFVRYQYDRNQAMLRQEMNKNANTSHFPVLPKSFFAGVFGSSTNAPSSQMSRLHKLLDQERQNLERNKLNKRMRKRKL